MAQSMKQNKKKKHGGEKKAVSYPTEVTLPPSATVKDLANLFGREVSEVIMQLMKLGIMATINQNVDPDAAALTKETLDEIFDPWDFLTRIDVVFERLEALEF